MIEKGYLIYANNNSKCNYVRQAYALSLSIKYFNKDAHVTVVTENTLCERLRAGFDDVIVPNKAPISQSVLNSEQRIHAYNISPYLKTMRIHLIKIFIIGFYFSYRFFLKLW